MTSSKSVSVAAAVGALLLRVPALFDGFWMDEIWSLRFASTLTGPLGVFTQIHYDNNHYVNTFWMWLIGPSSHWWLYRLPSLAAGVLTVILAARAGKRLLGDAGAVFCALLFMVGYPMIHYGTEARGYALAMFCALACFELLFAKFPRRAAVLFAVLAVKGLLGHLTFVFFLAAAWPWLLFQVFKGKRRLAALEWVCLFAVPAAALGALYWVDVRFFDLTTGGGDHQRLDQVVPSFYGYAFGFPRSGPGFAVGFTALAALIGRGWKGLKARGHVSEASLAVLCLFPALVGLVFFSGPVVVERYLLITLPFLYILAAAGIVDLAHGGLKPLAQAALAAICVGSLNYDVRFLKEGRGHYLDAVQYLEKHDPNPVIEVASDQPWRNAIVADYYSAFLPPERRLNVSNLRSEKNRPLWFFAHVIQDDAPEPPPDFRDPLGERFQLAERFPKWGLSGFRWFLYRRVEP